MQDHSTDRIPLELHQGLRALEALTRRLPKCNLMLDRPVIGKPSKPLGGHPAPTAYIHYTNALRIYLQNSKYSKIRAENTFLNLEKYRFKVTHDLAHSRRTRLRLRREAGPRDGNDANNRPRSAATATAQRLHNANQCISCGSNVPLRVRRLTSTTEPKYCIYRCDRGSPLIPPYTSVPGASCGEMEGKFLIP